MPDVPLSSLKIEDILRREGYNIIVGVDEVGRGPLAGPVVACALILPPDHNICGIKDSKALSEKEREELASEIRKRALACVIAQTGNRQIDRLNIRRATLLTMKRAVMNLIKRLNTTPDIVLVDGKDSLSLPVECRAIVKGDMLSENIGAASIVAKVYRDNLMKRLDKRFPQYGFAIHKGYGTRSHYEAIKRFGVCEIHRRSFRLY